MKKILSISLLTFALAANAQISFAGKFNLLFPTGKASWKNISNTATTAWENSGKNNVGFNLGLSTKINLPMSWFLMPEIYYTSFKNEYTNQNITFTAKSNRIDVPILVGHNVIGNTLGIFAGPVASYNLSNDNTYNDFKENAKSDFTVGYQFGAQFMLKQLIFSARYEGAFSKDERKFINNNINEEITYDNRPSLFLVGFGYQF